MFLEVLVNRLISISEVFNVCPTSVDLSPANLINDILIIREVVIVNILVISEEKGTKIQGELLISVVLG